MSPNPAGDENFFPYPGLRSFKREESNIFFGRDEQIDQLLEKLEKQHFLAVVGPSGCGKSSLVRAGMIAALETGFMASAGARWRIAEMRPGTRPLARLAEALAGPLALGPERGNSPETEPLIGALLRRGPRGLVEILRETPLPPRTNLLILVDQFEEVFRYRMKGGSNEVDAFVALLLAAKEQREFLVYVVVTMRSDFLGDCAVFPGMPEAINSSQFLTPRLSWDERKEAIVGPAESFGGEIESAVVNCLLNDSGSDPDQLPLLQHVLMRLWTLASNRRKSDSETVQVTLNDYRSPQIGGLARCLSLHADEAFLGLDNSQQRLAETLFRALCERGENRRDTRRPVQLGTVARIGKATADELAAVVEVFRRLDRSFLTPAAGVPLTSETVLDISHESLIRRWERMNNWAEQEAKSADIYRRLAQTALLWEKGEAALWSTPDLENALAWRDKEQPSADWADRYHPGFEIAMKFLAESKAEHDGKLARQAKARSDELRAKWVKSYAMVVSVVTIIFVLFMSAVIRKIREHAAASERDSRNSASNTVWNAKVHADEIIGAATRELKQATQEKDSVLAEAYHTAAQATLRKNELLSAIGYYATAKEQERYGLLRTNLDWTFLESQPPPFVRFDGLISGVGTTKAMAFDALGTNLVVLSTEGIVRILNVTNGVELDRFSVGTNFTLACFDRTGDWLVVVHQETNAEVWAVADKARYFLAGGTNGTGERITAAEFNLDGRFLAFGFSSGAVAVYEKSATNSVGGAATAVADDSVESREVRVQFQFVKTFAPAPPAAPASYSANAASGGNPVTSLAFGVNDGLLIVRRTAVGWLTSVKGGREMNLRDARSGQLYDLFGLRSVLFSPDGGTLIGFSDFDSWRNWKVSWSQYETDTANGGEDRTRQLASPIAFAAGRAGGEYPVFDQDYSFNSEYSANEEGGAFWEMGPMKQTWRQGGLIEPRARVVLTPTGEFAIQGSGQFLEFVSIGSDRHSLRPQHSRVRAHSAPILAIAASPDGSLLASASSDDTIRFWNVQSRSARTEIEANLMAATCLAFSPKGGLLAAGTRYGTVFVWNSHSGDKVLQVPAFPGLVSSICFSPDEEEVLCSDGETNSLLWRLGDASLIRFPEPLGQLAAFGPVDDFLGDVSETRARIWNWRTQELLASTNLQRNEYSPGSTISFTPGGDALNLPAATASIEAWSRWYLKTGNIVSAPSTNESQTLAFASSLDGRFYAEERTDGGQPIIWIRDFYTGSSTNLSFDYQPNAFAFSSHGNFYVVAYEDGNLTVWDQTAGREKSKLKTDLRIRNLTVRDDGEQVAMATWDNCVKIWNVADGEFKSFETPWLPQDPKEVAPLTGLSLTNMTLVPIEAEVGEQQFGQGTRSRPEPELARYWRAWQLTMSQVKKFGEWRDAPGSGLPRLELANWWLEHTNHPMSGTALQEIKGFKVKLAEICSASGIQHCRSGNYSNALSCFNQAIEIDDRCAKGYAGRWFAASQLNSADPVAAESWMARCRELDRDHAVSAEFVTNGIAMLETNDPRTALAWLNCALSIYPASVEACSWRVVACLQMTNTVCGSNDLAAVGSFGTNSDLAESLSDTARSFRAKDRTNRLALSCLTVSILLDPTNIDARLHNLDFYNQKLTNTDAVKIITDAIRLSTEPDPELYIHRARYYDAQREMARATADYEEAIRVGATFHNEKGNAYYERLYTQLAECRLHGGDYEGAIVAMTSALDRSPTNADNWVLLGYVYFEQGDWSRAITNCNRALSYDTNNHDAYFWLAIAYRNLGDWTNALANFDHLIAGATNANYLAQRGRVYRAMGDLQKAKEDLSRAEILASGDDQITVAFAKALQENFDGALKIFTEEISKNQDDSERVVFLARFYALRAASRTDGTKERRDDIEMALDLLESVVKRKDGWIWSRGTAAMDFAILRNESRFLQLPRHH